MIRILIVDDEKPICDLIDLNLSSAGYECIAVQNGLEAIELVEQEAFDLVLLDIMLPGADGYDVMDYIRPTGIPVIFITAKHEVKNRVKGLKLGADDYLVKPFEFEELLARIRAMLRRKKRDVLSDTVQIGDITINIAKKQVKKEATLIELTAKEYEVLEYLCRNRGQVLTRDQIREHVWGFEYEGESNIIDVIVKNIRKKTKDPALIKTKRGLGYVIKEA